MSHPFKNDSSHVPGTDPRNGPAALTVYLHQGPYRRSLETFSPFSRGTQAHATGMLHELGNGRAHCVGRTPLEASHQHELSPVVILQVV